jgi:hypothetical protein
VIYYRVVPDVPVQLVIKVSSLLRKHREEIGTRNGTRALTCWQQAKFILAWFRDKPDIRGGTVGTRRLRGPGDGLELRCLILGGPSGDVGEPVGADQAVPPFHRCRLTGGQALDRQCGRAGRQAEQGSLFRAGKYGADPLPAGVRPHPAAYVQFLVQGGVGEVHGE